MRILVVSDTHGNDSSLRRAILAQPKAEVVIHLGDGEEELLRAKRAFPEKMFLAVRGNCDFGSDLPLTGEFTAQGVKIFYTHGHYYGVKSGLYTFACAARAKPRLFKQLGGHLRHGGHHPPGDCDKHCKTPVNTTRFELT